MENLLKQLFVPWSQPDRVVGNVWVAASGSEVEDKKPHRVLRSGELHPGRDLPGGGLDHLRVEMGGIGVGDDDVSGEFFTPFKNNSLCFSVLHDDPVHRCLQSGRDPVPFHEITQSKSDCTGATHREVHTVLAFEVVNE